MQVSEMFSLANLVVMPMWLLLIVAPKWKVTKILADFKVIPLLLSLVYAVYIIKAINSGVALDFGSLSSVGEMFTHDEALLAGWVHYLAFDLMGGIWMVIKNRVIGLHPLLMAPCLFATFMLGPVGLLLFSILKTTKQSSL